MTSKELGVLVLACVALTAGRNHHVRGRIHYEATSFRCPSEGFHPDPNDCKIFYRCVDWNSNVFFRDFTEPVLAAFQFTCGEGTVFDPDSNTCNHPQETTRKECQSRGNPSNDQYPYEYPSMTDNKESAGYPFYEGNGNYPTSSSVNEVPQNNLESAAECSSEGFFPVPGDCNKFMRCVDNGMGAFTKFVFRCGAGTVWDQKNLVCNYPSAVPDCGGMGESSSGGGPPTTDNENQNEQGHYPEQSGYPEYGSYPERNPDQHPQGGYPGSYPDQGSGYPEYNPQQGTSPDEAGYNQGNNPEGSYGGYPTPVNRPPENPSQGYPQQPSSESHQGSRPSQYPQQGGYPEQPVYPQQGGYTEPSGYPSQGPENKPSGQQNQGYPQNPPTDSQVGHPNQYPQQGGYPEQSGYPQSGTYPSQGYPGENYPEVNQPDQGYPQGGGYPEDNEGRPTGESENGNGMSMGNSNECHGDGFFGVQGDCTKFYRCVNNGKGGYFRYDFTCGPGTVWDQDSVTCNHPWAVDRTDCSAGITSAGNIQSSSSQSTTDQSQPPMLVTTPPPYSSQMSTSSSSPSSTGQPNTDEQNQIEQATPMTPQSNATAKPQEGGSISSGNQTDVPPGSRPCKPGEKQVKCEKAGFYPLPGNCRKFYRCVDWDGDKGERFSVYFFECGEGTIWDPALQTCNHEESVYPARDCSEGGTEQGNETQSSTDKNPDTTESTTPEQTQTTSSEKPTTMTPEGTESSTDNDMTTINEVTTISQIETTMMTTQSQTDSNAETTQETKPAEATTEMTTSGNPEEETTASPGPEETNPNPSCPTTEEGQFIFVCPTGFRRSPRDCNLFYQCTISKEGDVNVMTFSCKNDTVYDERKIQCLPPDETEPCKNQPGSKRRVYRRIEPKMTSVIPIATSDSLCPHQGHFPYQGDCQRYFKCEKDRKGRMQGFLYQCPEEYSFSSSSGRCERSSTLPECRRSSQFLSPLSLKWMASKVPIEYFDVR